VGRGLGRKRIHDAFTGSARRAALIQPLGPAFAALPIRDEIQNDRQQQIRQLNPIRGKPGGKADVSYLAGARIHDRRGEGKPIVVNFDHGRPLTFTIKRHESPGGCELAFGCLQSHKVPSQVTTSFAR